MKLISVKWVMQNLFATRVWMTLLLTTGTIFFLWRGVYRAYGRSYDYAWNYLSTRAWIAGTNPYDLESTLAQRPIDFPAAYTLQGVATPHPPAVFPLSSVLAIFDWQLSLSLFLVINLLLWTAALLLLSLHFQLRQMQRGMFFGLSLLSYPLHSALSLGQYASPATACLLIAWTLSRSNNKTGLTISAGACSLALKPQIGIIFVLVIAIERRWDFLFFLCVLYGIFSLVGIGQILFSGFSLGDIAKIMPIIQATFDEQAQMFCCVNLSMITRNLGLSSFMRILLDIGFVIAVSILLILHARRHRLDEVSLFVTVYALALLVTYHRPYDLAGLLVVIAWLCSHPPLGWRNYAMALCVILIVQPVPSLPALEYISRIAPFVTEDYSFLWSFVILPHTTWMLVALALVAVSNQLPSDKQGSGTCISQVQ